ncbi:hypothetical protein M9458_046715, partial [Cirrhinus mrigala]
MEEAFLSPPMIKQWRLFNLPKTLLRFRTCKTLKPARGMDNSTQTNITLKYLKHMESLAKFAPPSAPYMTMLDSFHSPS